MPQAGKPHWRHEAWIYIYASTLPTFLMPHSHFSPRNPCWTQRNQINTMPSTRTGRRYSTRPSMPSFPTFRQGSHVSSSPSMTSNSVLRGLPPYRRREQIPDITLPEYGMIIKDNDDYEDLMAILFPQSDLYSRTITMRHLSITAQKLRREVERQEVEVRRIFIEIEGLGLQQVLRPYRNAPPQESFLPATRPPTPYYPAPSQETRSPTPPTNITTTGNTRKPNHHWRWWRTWQTKWQLLHCRVDLLHTSFLPPTLSRMHRSTTSILWMSTIYMQSLLSTSPRTSSVWLSRGTLKPVTSTIVGDIVTNSFSSLTHVCIPFISLFHIWSTCILLNADMPFTYVCYTLTLCFTCVHLRANTCLLPI